MAIDFNAIYGYNSNSYKLSISGMNTSNARFKGTVTGYKGVEGKYGGSINQAMTSTETKEYISGLKEFGNKLKNAALKMMEKFPPLFDQMTAAADNTDALSVSYDNKSNKSIKSFDVEINRLAESQTNTGNSMQAAARTDANKGYNSFAIDSGGKTYNFNINISAADTNRSTQQKMADAINKSGAGVTAKVTYNDKTKESSLVIEGNKTGGVNGFNIRDTGNGNLVATTGAASTTREATDALYSVNGAAKSSASNTVDFGNGVKGTLKKANETATVGMKQDTDKILSSINDLVKSYNGLLSTANDNKSDSGARSIARQLTGTASAYNASLSKIGISTDSNGYLKVDEDKLKASIENGSARSVLESDKNSSYGFANKLNQLASSVDANPSRYVGKSTFAATNSSNNETGSLKGLGMSFWNEYKMSQMTGIGLLFDGVF